MKHLILKEEWIPGIDTILLRSSMNMTDALNFLYNTVAPQKCNALSFPRGKLI